MLRFPRLGLPASGLEGLGFGALLADAVAGCAGAAGMALKPGPRTRRSWGWRTGGLEEQSRGQEVGRQRLGDQLVGCAAAGARRLRRQRALKAQMLRPPRTRLAGGSREVDASKRWRARLAPLRLG